MMETSKVKQIPKHEEFRKDSFTGDPLPRGAGDQNRGYHVPKQTKDKIFQNLDEIYNDPTKSNHGAIYDSGTDVRGIPNNMDSVVRNGPFKNY